MCHDVGMALDQHQQQVQDGGTVRFLHVEGIGRQVELSDAFMSAPGGHSGSVSSRNPVKRDQ